MDEITEQQNIDGILRLCATILLADKDVIWWIAGLVDVPVEVAGAAMANISEKVVEEEIAEMAASSSLVAFLTKELDGLKVAIRGERV